MEPQSDYQPEARRGWRNNLFIGVVILFWGSLYIYAPTLPNYVKMRVDNLAVVGIIISMYGLWQMVSRFPLGIASDWTGQRKPFIITAFILNAIGSVMLGSADSEIGLLIARSITGLAAANWVTLLVFFSQSYKAEDALKATSLLTFISSIARMSFTSLNGFLNDTYGYSMAYYLAGALSVLAVLLMLIIKEKPLPQTHHNFSELGKLITRPDVLGPSLLNLILQYISYATTFGFLPILAKELGAGDVLLSMLMSLYLLALTIGNLTATLLLKRTSLNLMIAGSFILTALAILIAAMSRSYWPVIGAQLLAGYAMGIGLPLMMGMSIQYVDPSERATAMGLHQAVYAAGMFLGPWISGYLARAVGIQPMFAITAAGGLILGIIGIRYLNKPRAEHTV